MGICANKNDLSPFKGKFRDFIRDDIRENNVVLQKRADFLKNGTVDIS